MYVNWPGHPSLSKKKKKKNLNNLVKQDAERKNKGEGTDVL